MSAVTITLPPGELLTVVADSVSSGNVFPFSERVGDTPGNTAVSAGATATFGPFSTVKRYSIVSVSGALAYSSAPVDFPTVAETVAAALASLPAVVGTVGDLCEIIGAGVPVDYTDGTPPATGEGVAGPGSRYTDVTAGTLYLNIGTKAQPIWKQLAPVA